MNLKKIVLVISCMSAATLAYANEEYLSAYPLQDSETRNPSTPTPEKSLLSRYTTNAQELVVRALSQIGVNYHRGGESPESGFDCSGFVRYVFRESLGHSLPRTAFDISRLGEKITRDALEPGDLVFFNTRKKGFSHVGIYLGDDRFVHSPASGGEVRVEDIRMNYWLKRFNGARRIASSEAHATNETTLKN